jgi:hypothetical protein
VNCNYRASILCFAPDEVFIRGEDGQSGGLL